MDPLTIGMSAISAAAPLAEKGMDLIAKLIDSTNQDGDKGQGKAGEDVHQKPATQIQFG